MDDRLRNWIIAMAGGKKNLEALIPAVIISGVFAGLWGGSIYTVYSYTDIGGHKKHSRLYKESSIKADINKDEITTEKEWAQVYKQLGIQFDTYTSNPERDLTKEQLEQYLTK